MDPTNYLWKSLLTNLQVVWVCSSTGLLPRCSDGSDHGVSQLRDILESLGLVSEQKKPWENKKTKTPKKNNSQRLLAGPPFPQDFP